MSCECPTPSPSSCGDQYDSDITSSSAMIKLYLGERYDKFTSQLSIFSTQNEDFSISYSAMDLVEAGVLPQAVLNTNETAEFTLTEKELLNAGSYETWITYVTALYGCSPPIETFGSFVLESLGIDLQKWGEWSESQLNNMNIGRDNSFFGKFSDFFRWLFSFDKAPTLDVQDRETIEAKIILCYEWFKRIYDNYYGKTYLVKIGEITPEGSASPALFNGVCIKDKNGNFPTTPRPFFVDGDGSAQGLYISDEISSDGGLNSAGYNYLLGLNLTFDSDIFRTDDGKLDCVVRVATLGSSSESFDPTINKFGRNYVIDISKLSPENYVISSRAGTGGFAEYNLFVRASVANRIYVLDDGQWALVTLSQLVPLIDNEDSRGNYRWATAATQAFYPDSIKQYLDKLVSVVSGTAVQPDKHGALNNSTIYNMIVPSDISIIPEAAAIPMKSNILRYGPYYGAGDTSGGVEVVSDERLAPWNFLEPPTSGLFPSNLSTAYAEMNNVGQKLAEDSIKTNLFLEKGKITVAGIPQFPLAHQPATNPILGDVLGPQALLTDIAVSYGNGGFTTTYNFSSYAPRFGQPGKYLIDRWTDSIKETQHINRYLREERQKVRHLANTLNQKISTNKIASGQIGNQIFSGPKGKNSTTPNKLLFSGYYLSDTLPDSNTDSSYSSIVDLNGSDVKCDPCASESPPPSLIPPPEPSIGNIYRLFPFAETHESYTDEYIQGTYYQLSIMSLDGFFLPVSLKGNPKPEPSTSGQCNISESDYRLPRFAMRQDTDATFIEFDDMDFANDGTAGYASYTKSRYSMPPFELSNSGDYNAYNLPITQQYLNPIISEVLLNNWDTRKNNSTNGFVISSIAFGCTFEDYQLNSTCNNDTERQSNENFRFSALRGPLVVQGWGYDTNGRPIPNQLDIPKKAEAGKFKRTGLSDKFMDNWLSNPKTWPVGPVDLRFDRERGVWTCPSPNKIIVARLKEPLLPYKKAKAELINPSSNGINFYENFDISGPNGENVKESLANATIEVYDFLGVRLCECDIIYAYYDENRYIVLESNRAYTNSASCTPCTPTPCPSPSFSLTPIPSPSPSFSIPATPSITPSPSIGISPSPSIAPSISASIVPSASIIPSVSISIAPSVSVSIPPSVSASVSIAPSVSVPPPSFSPQPSIFPSPSSCWCGLECLQGLQNYNPCRTQALIHKNGCLMWEDIVQCDPIQNSIEKDKEEECNQIYNNQNEQ